ncbi:MAG: HDIG domain-containing metalloprotein [Candidatus Aenigmatarchaeota archaeon]
MDREEALSLIKEGTDKKNLIKHMLAVEAIMKGAAEFLGDDIEKWDMTGLLHDVDFEKTEENPKEHGVMAETILEGKVDKEIIDAIKSHNFEYTGVQPKTKMDFALIAADAVSGLIIANALIISSKKLADITPENVAKRFKEKDFARRCRRELILYCEKVGIPKEKFFEISLKALQNISDELGL